VESTTRSGLRSIAEFRRDGSGLAIKQSDQHVAIFELNGQGASPRPPLSFPRQVVEDLVWSEEGSRLAVVLSNEDGSGEVAVWDREWGVFEKIPSESLIYDASFSPDGERVVMVEARGVSICTLSRFDFGRSRERFIHPHGATVYAARLSRKGSKIVLVQAASVRRRVSSSSATARIDGAGLLRNSGGEIHVFELQSRTSRHLAPSAELTDAIVCTVNGLDRVFTWSGNVVECWTLGGTPVNRYLHDEKVEQVAVSADGSRMVSWTARGMLRVWNTQTGSELQMPVIAPGTVQFAGVDSEGVLWAMWNRNRLHRWPARLPTTAGAESVHDVVARRFGWRVDEEEAKLIPVAHEFGAESAASFGARDDMQWGWRQVAECAAEDDWDAALLHYERLEKSLDSGDDAEEGLILNARSLLANGDPPGTSSRHVLAGPRGTSFAHECATAAFFARTRTPPAAAI
jgi:hypothetical protein